MCIRTEFCYEFVFSSAAIIHCLWLGMYLIGVFVVGKMTQSVCGWCRVILVWLLFTNSMPTCGCFIWDLLALVLFFVFWELFSFGHSNQISCLTDFPTFFCIKYNFNFCLNTTSAPLHFVKSQMHMGSYRCDAGYQVRWPENVVPCLHLVYWSHCWWF